MAKVGYSELEYEAPIQETSGENMGERGRLQTCRGTHELAFNRRADAT